MTSVSNRQAARTNEYRRLTRIKDPVAALDACRSAIGQLKKGFWSRRRTYLSVLASNAERVSASKTAWRTFIGKEFWKNCVGEKPRMEDRREPLSFVVRYGENAVTRQAYQSAWRYTEVLNYLIKLGTEPKAMAAYLAKPGQGMNATYKKAVAQKKKSGKAAERANIKKAGPTLVKRTVHKSRRGTGNDAKAGSVGSLQANAVKPRERPTEVPMRTSDTSRPPSSSPRPHSPAAAPKMLYVAKDARVQSPQATNGIKLSIFAEGRKRAFSSRLTPAQAKAALRVNPREFRHAAAYFLALAKTLTPPTPADTGYRTISVK